MKIPSLERIKELVESFPQLNPMLVVGDLGIDKYTYGDVQRISPEAPVPILKVSKEWFKLGLAANVTDNLKSLGANSTLCGVIGADTRGGLLENLLEEKGLKTWGLVRTKERPTTYKERITTKTQQICRVDYEDTGPIDATSEAKLINRIEDFVADHSCLIIEDYAKGLITEGLCTKVISIFKGAQMKVAVDPSRHTPPQWYKGATLLKPNLIEAKLMVEALGHKEERPEKMAEILVRDLNLEKIVITLGAEGMGYLDTQGLGTYQHVPTIQTEVYDVSGAGDTAISAIWTSLMVGATLEEAVWIGNCASSVVVGKKGTALVTKEEIYNFYETRLSKMLK